MHSKFVKDRTKMIELKKSRFLRIFMNPIKSLYSSMNIGSLSYSSIIPNLLYRSSRDASHPAHSSSRSLPLQPPHRQNDTLKPTVEQELVVRVLRADETNAVSYSRWMPSSASLTPYTRYAPTSKLFLRLGPLLQLRRLSYSMPLDWKAV